jgi:hypothetical protein
MRQIYLRVENNGQTRKVLIDMAFLAKHNFIRLPKYYFEENLYLPFKKQQENGIAFEKYALDKSKIKKEDENFYYFKFPFKFEQVFDIAI